MPSVAVMEVPNPHGLRVPDMIHVRGELRAKERTVVVVRQLRDDPLGQMHDRKQINFAQYRAGRIYQAYHEAAGIGTVRSQDPSVEPVDGGGHVPAGITDRQARAMDQLKKWHRLLGSDGTSIIDSVLVHKRTIREAATRYGPLTRANLVYTGHRFRECLDTLAGQMGLG